MDSSDVIFNQGKTYKCLSGLEGIKIAPPSQEGAGAIRSVTDEIEKRNCEAIERVSYAGVYEYEVPETRSAFQSAIIALKYVAIAGRCLNRLIHEVPLVKAAHGLEGGSVHRRKAAGAELDLGGLCQVFVCHQVAVVALCPEAQTGQLTVDHGAHVAPAQRQLLGR